MTPLAIDSLGHNISQFLLSIRFSNTSNCRFVLCVICRLSKESKPKAEIQPKVLADIDVSDPKQDCEQNQQQYSTAVNSAALHTRALVT